MRNRFLVFALVAFLSCVGQPNAHASFLYAAVTDGSFHGVATFDANLNLVSQVGLSGPITGLAAGQGGNYYTAVGNTIYVYDAGGNQLDFISGSGTTMLPALSFASGQLYAAVTDGAFYGVATFDANLNLVSQVGLSGPITGLAAGLGGNYYTAVGNTIYEYDSAGNQLEFITGSGTTMLPALSYSPAFVGQVSEPSTVGILALAFFLLGTARMRAMGRTRA